MSVFARSLVAAVAVSLATVVTTVTAPAFAETSDVSAVAPRTPDDGHGGFHADFEFDPTAYVLSGYSLHVGLGYHHVRLDLGNFAIGIPKVVHGNDGFSASGDGYGAKLQFFPFAEQRGFFFGVDAGVQRIHVERDGTDLAAKQTQIGVGVHLGVRIPLPAGFYVTPWLGVSHDFGAKDVTLGGATYSMKPVTVFPAVHLGYRFF